MTIDEKIENYSVHKKFVLEVTDGVVIERINGEYHGYSDFKVTGKICQKGLYEISYHKKIVLNGMWVDDVLSIEYFPEEVK